MNRPAYQRQWQPRGRNLGTRLSLWGAIHIDPWLLLLLLILSGGGLFVLYSASGAEAATVSRQALRLLLGCITLLALAQIPPRWYQRWAPWLYGVGILLLLGVLVAGVAAKGAQRWLELPGIGRFQPSELLKLIVPLMLAAYLSRQRLPPDWRTLISALGLIAAPTLLIARQPDLGTALLVASSGIIVLFLAGLQWRYLLGALAAAPLAGLLLWSRMHDYQKQRVLTFLNPESDPWGAGWNITQSVTAIGSGGLQGKGWLSGTQAQLDFLPESSTDFIVAVIAEEFGLIGTAALLLLYLLIVARGLWIAYCAQDRFSRLLAGGITLLFFVYVFVNIGMVSGLLPIVGVPLPLISYGGTSIISLLAGFGILMSVQTHRKLLSTG